MKIAPKRLLYLATIAALCAMLVVPTLAQDLPAGVPVLLGTTGACNNLRAGGPCTQQSTLVQLDPATGQLIKVIGPVGFTVNGLASDPKTGKLFATTAVGDVRFHGLITIDPETGVGTPVDATVDNFGLAPDPRFVGSPVHSITIGANGKIVGWYDEFAPPAGVTDTFVHIDKNTGVATEFSNTGIDTSQNGLSFDTSNLLWNIDSPKLVSGTLTQTAYILNPVHGKPTYSRTISPPFPAALGDFNPVNNLYYGLNFEAFSPTHTTFIEVVDVRQGSVTTLGQTVDDLHVIAFIKNRQ